MVGIKYKTILIWQSDLGKSHWQVFTFVHLLSNKNFLSYLLQVTKAQDCKEQEVLQTLWSGYGKIVRYRLKGGKYSTVIVKHISFQEAQEHPRGWNTATSHQRKLMSYKVETNWYRDFASQTTSSCKVPNYLGSFHQGKDQWILLEDLDTKFPLRKAYCTVEEAKRCLHWLANFHAQFLGVNPEGLWEIGTYWHLATRPDEFEQMQDSKLKEKASEIDGRLNACNFKTLVHGDAKVANFCFSRDSKQVAVVDFQYVGGGCGMKDVAYFLGSCLTSEECQLFENELLDHYFSCLKEALVRTEVDVAELETDWRDLYPYACADFTRFLLGWMPTHRKVNDYYLGKVEEVVNARS